MNNIVRIQPLQYIHVQDLNTNVTVLEIGPQSLILQDNHVLVLGPCPFIVIPPGHYSTIENPVKKPYKPGQQCNLQHGHREIRLHKEPFPLYPGEVMVGVTDLKAYQGGIKKLPVIGPNQALRLEAMIDHEDGDVDRLAGDMWQLDGPMTYYPTPFAEIRDIIDANIIHPGQALNLSAMQDLVDKKGKKRVTGEEWLVREPGAYLPGIYEEVMTGQHKFDIAGRKIGHKVIGLAKAHTLTQDVALHMKARTTCVDALGKKRYAGDEWLVTIDDAESYIPEVAEELVQEVSMTVLSKEEHCVVLDPVDSKGKNQLGIRELRKGVASFFLRPGERLENGIQKAHLLESDEALVLSATDRFVDDSLSKKVQRCPGDRWMILGPMSYIPPIQVKVITKRKAIPLNENEGLYVRDTRSGEVRSVMGPQAYLLMAYEELWSKELPDNVELILKKGGGHGTEDIRKLAYFDSSIDPNLMRSQGRDKTRVIVYRCPGNTAVQVNDYKQATARVIFGPDLVVLGPHENFNVLSLSAGKPKKPNALQTICLMLGPDFITDVFEVETSDHARLMIKIAMNNYFDVDPTDPESVQSIFSVPDFIGFVCKNVASRIRGSVAQVPFDEFHRYSVRIIKKAVFGEDEKGNIKTKLRFDANNLVITNVDIQSIEPVDRNMRESLSKSVQMAIEISTKSIEMSAAHEAKRTEQVAKGQLERQKLINEKEAEEARKKLYELQAVTAAVESAGQTQAEARAKAEKSLIEGESAIELAKLRAEANEIKLTAELHADRIKREGELEFIKQQNQLKIQKAEKLASIQVEKFSAMVKSIGPKTITNIAESEPKSQVSLLQSLGVDNVIITDGLTPLNLFQSSQGFLHTATSR